MAVTATDETRAHYQRPEVREIITRYAMPGDGADGAWRVLNGDFSWWYHNEGDIQRLLNVDDYDQIINKVRTLYQSLNVFWQPLRFGWRDRPDDSWPSSALSLGTLRDTIAYSLGVDIDRVGGDIEEPAIKAAVEAAAQFLVDDLKKNGIVKSTWAAFSGGGIYIHVHHGICRPAQDGPDVREEFFVLLTDRFNSYIQHISEEFFKIHPEHADKVKFDSLNNQKRVFKCILSIHKTKDYAVTPLNRDAIKIDFDRARLPLKPDMIEDAGRWYSTFDPAEREPLLKLLDNFKDEEKETRARERLESGIRSEPGDMFRSPVKTEVSDFPPCIKNIIGTPNTGEGKTRFAGVLSAYLFQAGWGEDEAWDLVRTVSDRNGLGGAEHIFDSCFGAICCPTCKTIQEDAAGYPHLGLKGLGACKQDEKCDTSPCDYGITFFMDEWCKRAQIERENAVRGAGEPARAISELILQDLTKAKGRKRRVNPITGEFEADPETGEDTIPELTLSPTKASAAILNHMPLRRSATDTAKDPAIWRCVGGIWHPDGEEVIEVLINSVAGDLSYERGRQETFKRIRGMADRVTFDSDPFLLPAQDGMVDLKTGEVSDYGPDAYVTFRYGAEVKGEADIRPSLWLLCSSLPDPRDVLTALDICGEAVIRRPSDSIIQLIGAGSNGKGMFERMISELVTDERISNITLSEAKASRFGPGEVLGKDLWILSEVEEVKQAINLLKKVATGERMDSDQKYGGRIRGKPHVLPILDCNNAIDFGDDSWGRKRRVIKLDWPFTFGYTPDTRLKDPHWEDKITSPMALAGLLQIIVARAPHLIESKRIYNRKKPEEMAEEYRRQQYSLHYFCEECLTTEKDDRLLIIGGEGERLTTTKLFEEYQEYCRLFHVPVPAGKGQVGKYIKEKFTISSVVSRENNVQVRYYPGLWIAKSATKAHADISLSYDSYNSYSKATAKLQEKDSKNSIRSLLATAATEEWPKEVIAEIERMFKFIESCENPQEISYENYLQKCCNTVAAVALGQQIAIPEKSAVAKGQSAVATTVAKPDPQVYLKMEIDYLRTEIDGKSEETPPTGGEETPTPTTAQALPEQIELKLRKAGRKDSTGRHGLAVSDLEPGELEFLHGMGWTDGTIEVSGVRVLWAPAKPTETGA